MDEDFSERELDMFLALEHLLALFEGNDVIFHQGWFEFRLQRALSEIPKHRFEIVWNRWKMVKQKFDL